MDVRLEPWRRLSAEENRCFWTMVLEKTLDSKEIKLVNPKGNQSWVFIGRTDAEVETPILWLPDMNSQIIRKGPDVEKDWSPEEKMTENKMVWWHHRLNGCEFKQAPGDGEGQGSQACYSPWGHKKLDTAEQLNKKEQCSLCPCKAFFRSQARIPKDAYTVLLFFLNSNCLNVILNLPQ